MSSSGRRIQVTLTEVAERALVSLGTASRVLNNHPNVQPELRLRVLAAASELGYSLGRSRANYYIKEKYGNGSGVVLEDNPPSASHEGQISHVAFCCRPVISPLMDEAYNPYFSSMLHGVEVECREQDLHLIYRIINDDKSALAEGRRKLTESGAEALMLINFIDQDLVNGLLELNLPTVLVDHHFPNIAIDIISHENYAGAVQAINYLFGKGHHRIGFVNGLPHYTIQRRFEGYRQALENAGVVFDPETVIEGDLKVEGGKKAADEIVARKLDCTAYFCANDETAIGLIQGLRANGLQVPEDISVVGFDDIGSARLITPTLTTIHASPAWVGRMAVRKLIERVKSPNLPITHTLLTTSLIERESVKSLV